MKNVLLLALIAMSFTACDTASGDVTPKDNGKGTSQPPTGVTDFSKQTLILQGSFVGSPAHSSTTGKAKLYKAEDNKLTLLIEDLKVDSGPDLRIYLAEDKAITNFVELSSTVRNGTASYNVPTSINLEKNRVISIWCKQFSVSFGSSTMTAL